jgi:hypothetical protein
MYQVLALCVCVCLSLEITHPYSQRVFFIPSFVLSSFSDDDDDVFWIIRPGFYSLLFSKDHLPAGADPASKLDDTFVDLNDIETIVSSDLVF